MPRDGLGNFTAYAPPVVTQTTIDSGVHNGLVADFVTDANAKRPIIAGGTAASSAKEARTNLQAEVAGAQVTNYDDHVFENGSFYSAIAATGAPNATDYFVGTAIILTPPNVSLVLVARSMSTGAPYVRIKTGSAWAGPWVIDAAGEYVNTVGDTMTGHLGLPVGPAAHQATRKDYVDAADATVASNAAAATSTAQAAANAAQGTANTAVANAATAQTAANNANANANNRLLRTSDTLTGNLWVTGQIDCGAMVCTGNTTVQGSMSALNAYYGSIVHVASAIDYTGHSIWNSTAGTGYKFYMIGGAAYIGGSNASGNATGVNVWKVTNSSVEMLQAGGAWKPGGGSWADNSDARIKTVLGDYDSGLDAVLELRPVRYTFKGNDTPYDVPPAPPPGAPEGRETATAPFPDSPHYASAVEAKQYIGLIAQEVETVMPEMVGMGSARIDGVPVTDLRGLDTTPLLFALVNAIKELTVRVQELEARLP